MTKKLSNSIDVKKEKNMKTKTEIRDWLLNNAVDEGGDLRISNLDFSEFEGDVYINNMKVQGDLNQNYHEVKGNLYQHRHEVKGSLFQGNQEVQGDLYQDCQKVKGDLFQGNQDVKSDLYNTGSECGGNIYESPSTKLLKEVTAEELAKIGYKLKGE